MTSRTASTLALLLALSTRAHADAPNEPVPSEPAAAPPAAPAEPAATYTPVDPAIAPPGLARALPAQDTNVTPPLSAGRLVGETVAGAGVGVVGVFVGGFIGYRLECSGGCSGEFAGLGGLLLGGYIGASIGIGAGVYMVGSSGDQTGSLGMAIGGAFLGSFVGAGGAALIEKAKGNSYNSVRSHVADVMATTVAIGSWIGGAMLGFNVTRKSTHHDLSVGSAVRFDHGRATLGVPLVVRSSEGSYLSLASGSF